MNLTKETSVNDMKHFPDRFNVNLDEIETTTDDNLSVLTDISAQFITIDNSIETLSDNISALSTIVSGISGVEGFAEVTSSAGSVSIDINDGQKFKITLTEDTTIENPSNINDGEKLTIRIKQDETGNHSLTFGSKYKITGYSGLNIKSASKRYLFKGLYDSSDDMVDGKIVQAVIVECAEPPLDTSNLPAYIQAAWSTDAVVTQGIGSTTVNATGVTNVVASETGNPGLYQYNHNVSSGSIAPGTYYVGLSVLHANVAAVLFGGGAVEGVYIGDSYFAGQLYSIYRIIRGGPTTGEALEMLVYAETYDMIMFDNNPSGCLV